MLNRTLASIFLGLVGSALLAEANNTSFSLFATDLSGCDDLSKCDAFVKVFLQSKLTDWKLIGQTAFLQDNNFPVWPDIFTVDHVEGNRERFRFELIDDDTLVNDKITTVEMDMETFLTATETQNTYGIDLVRENGNPTGRLYIRRENRDQE